MTKLEKRSGCIYGAMEIIGQKWTALILRDLSYDSKRFVEIEKSIGNINPRTLSKRLNDLEASGVISHCPDNIKYQLTQKGEDLIPVLKQMAAWGDKYC